MGEANVTEQTDAVLETVTAPAVEKTDIKCPECGKPCNSEHGLKVHQAFKHGKKKVHAAGTSKKRGPYKKKAAAADGEASVKELFAMVAASMDENAKLIEECVQGLGVLLKKAKALRLPYIKRSREVQLLRQEAINLED